MPESSLRQRGKFVFAEFFVIVLGVLVALGVDEYRTELAEDALEAEYGDRLIADLVADSATFEWFEGVLNTKAAVLTQLLADPNAFVEFDDPVVKMTRVVYSTFVGLPQASAVTFNELQTTGLLSLFDDEEIRSALGAHYAGYGRITEILDDRFGLYREAVFASLPGTLQFESRLDTTAVDPEALRSGLQRLIQVPDIEAAANAEMAYTASMLFYLREADQTAAALRQLLRETD